MIGYGLIALGVSSLIAARHAESYHSRRFQEHLDAMKSAYLHRGEQEAVREHEDFVNDRRVDLAVAAMTWGYPLGMLCVVVGVSVLIF